MNKLVTKLENIPIDEPWYVCIGKDEYILSNFEAVDPSIYGRSDLLIADVVKEIKAPRSISNTNKIEFAVSDISIVRSLDSTQTLYSR